MRQLAIYVALLSLLSASCSLSHPAVDTSKTYKIGWQNSHPYQVKSPDGSPTGLAVDLVREAARRRHIQLEWIYSAPGPEASLRSHAVDLWPVITITPARAGLLHITDPFIQPERCLIVRADSSFRHAQDLTGHSVGVVTPKVEAPVLHAVIPNVTIVQNPNSRELIAGVCNARLDAALFDSYAGISALLDDRDCSRQGLRWIQLPQMQALLGIGSTFESAPVADALRREITAISREGKLAAIVGPWGYMSSQGLESMSDLIEARRRESGLAILLSILAIFFLAVCGQTLRLTHQRNRTRAAQVALQESERNLRLVANGLTEMVIAYDMTGKLIYANPATEILTGFTPTDLDSDGLPAWVHPDDRPHMAELRKSVMAGATLQFEFQLVTKAGSRKWVSASCTPILDPQGRQIGIQASQSDITQRRLAEEALRQSEQRFRSLLEDVQMVAILCDQKGNCIFCNDFFLSMSGWTREEVLNRPALEFIAPEDLNRATRIAESWSIGGQPSTWFDELILITKAGDRRWLQANHVTLYGPGGEPVGFATLAGDTTEYRALRDQYLQAQKLEAIGLLAGGIAHDFNNLLTVIQGYSELLTLEIPPSSPLSPSVAAIQKAAQQAETLTRQLLAFSRKHQVQLEPVDVNLIVSSNMPMFARLLGENIELRHHLEPTLGITSADPSQLTQALLNLAINARDAMPHGGALTFTTETLSPTQLRLTVSDTGTGIPLEVQERIFDPFFTTKSEGKGTGLGLSMVYGTIRQFGGSISVRSQPNQGTSFDIDLPIVASRHPSPAEPITEPAILPRGTETILVVEDREGVRQFAVKLLEQCGYILLEAINAEHALRAAHQYPGPIHLLLTDLLLPGMSGEELARHWKEIRPLTKIVFMSGHQAQFSVDFLPKPFTAEQLSARVRAALDAPPVTPEAGTASLRSPT